MHEVLVTRHLTVCKGFVNSSKPAHLGRGIHLIPSSSECYNERPSIGPPFMPATKTKNDGTRNRMPPLRRYLQQVLVTSTARRSAAAAFFACLGFVDLEVTAFEISAIERLDRIIHGGLRIHCHESEATWAAAVAIFRKVHVCDASKLGEKSFNRLLGRLERQVAYIHFHNSSMVHALCRFLRLFPLFGFQITTEFVKPTWQHSRSCSWQDGIQLRR